MRYELISSTRSNDNSISYGIKCVCDDSTSIIIEDISSDKETVLRLVNDCNTYNLSQIHIFDVIDDTIG